MFELALHYNGRPMSVSYISQKENISVPYLEQLLGRLRRKGLVKSIRGPKGGYTLAKKPHDITVGDIIRVLDGDITPVHCAANGLFNKNCNMIDRCVTKVVWQRLKDAIDDMLDNVTLKDLCNDARRKGVEKDTYYMVSA